MKLCCITILVALLTFSAPAAAAPKPITGKLTEPGYTVIALSAGGKAKSARTSKSGKFKLRPPAKRVTLHLRAPDATYAGPIVVGRKGKRAIVGVKAGAKLGKVRVVVRKHYAKLAKRLRGKWIDADREARARRGVPIGARAFGRVRSRRASGPAADRDLDGIPGPLDIDDDGDLVLDNLDRPKGARGAARQEFAFEFNLAAEINQTANANATGLSVAQMDAFLVRNGSLIIDVPPGDSAELDCGSPQSRTDPRLGGLSYCSAGGTGQLVNAGSSTGTVPFPGCCDPDGDGFGTLARSGKLLLPRATSAQIGTGDVLIQRVTTRGAETQFAATLQYVFATVPALVAYADGQGNSATVRYPVASPDPRTGRGGGPGTRENPFPVRTGPNGDIVVTMTFWRPQRRPIPPETGTWTDIGGLIYEVDGGNLGRDCPQRAYSTTNPNLTPAPTPGGAGEEGTGGLRDLARDKPASPANTFSYKLNLTHCLGPESWRPGETKMFSPRGTDRTAYASQIIFFRRQ